MKVLLDTSIGPRKYKLASYDIPTGKMIQQIAEKDFYCSDAVWSPDASTIAYDVLGNLYWVKPSSISSTPKLFFAGKNKNIIVTNLQFISENKILFLLHGNHYFSGDRFIVYDINTGQEIQNWPAPNYCNDLRIIGNYAVWEN